MDQFVLYVACLTVFSNCLVKQFAKCLGVVVILLLNVFSVGGGGLLDILCMVLQRMRVLCLSSQCVSKYSIHTFCLCFYVGSYLLI